MHKHWVITPPATNLEVAAAGWGVSPLVAQLLVNRGLCEKGAVRSFLSPELVHLHPPQLLHDMDRAVDLIVEAVQKKKSIILYGDYDVDGTTGVAILWHVLTLSGAVVDYYVPHRIEEGYGLNMDAVDRLVRQGAGLIVSIDCGITATDVAAKLKESGVPLVVTDHHAHSGTLPSAAAIVHPGLNGYPNPDLCGAGVAFKLAWAIAQRVCGSERVRPEFRELLSELLSLAALGTIADVVRLQGENRIIAKHGLDRLTKTRLPGLKALIEKAGLTGEKVNGYDVGFKLAPRINAAGRMGHACRAVELMTHADAARAFEIAMYLEDHNRTRQSTERRMSEQAFEFVEKHNLASDARRAIVWADEGWHPGVIGIVAARLVERFHRPTILIALSNGEGQGSGRSIRHFNLAAALNSCGEHLISHGGHEMAAGLKIRRDKIAAFSESFVELANQRLTGNDLRPTLRIDAEVSLRSLTRADVEAITRMGPFGMGNPRPKLSTDWVELAGEPRLVGRDETHLQASFRQDGVVIRAIGFGLADRIEDLKQHRRCQVAFEPMVNHFNGSAKVEMQALDLRFPE